MKELDMLLIGVQEKVHVHLSAKRVYACTCASLYVFKSTYISMNMCAMSVCIVCVLCLCTSVCVCTTRIYHILGNRYMRTAIVKTTFPCRIPCFQSPVYVAPSVHVNTPNPWRMPCSTDPLYVLKKRNVMNDDESIIQFSLPLCTGTS